MTLQEANERIEAWLKKTMAYFSDYEDELKEMFSIAIEFKWDELIGDGRYPDIEEKYLRVISEALRYAGSPGEKGYAYNGIKLIEEYMPRIQVDYLEAILRYNSYKKEKQFGNKLRPKLLKVLIDNVSVENQEERDKLKFRFFDSNLIGRMIYQNYVALLRKKYPDYRYANLDENDKDERELFAKFVNDTGKVFYIKVDNYNSTMFFISRTHEKDISTMNYREDIKVFFEDRKINIYMKGLEKPDLTLKFSSENYELEQYEDYEDDISNRFPDIRETTGKFELVYVYGEDLYDLPPISLKFKSAFDISIEPENQKIFVKEVIQEDSMPQDFWDENITAIHALIGQNGSGKSTVFKLIFGCKLFFPFDKQNDNKYFIIYKYDDEYYYSNTTGRKVVFSETHLKLTEYNAKVDVNTCLISNVYELFSDNEKKTEKDLSVSSIGKGFHKLPQSVIDLTTQSIVDDNNHRRHEDFVENSSLLMEDHYRIESLKNFFGDDLKKFKIKPFERIEELSSGEKTRVVIFARLLSFFM